MTWYNRTITYNEQGCPLTHLAPFSFKTIIPRSANKPALAFTTIVKFSTHCVSVVKERLAEGSTQIPFPDEGGQERYFSQERYDLSLMLPDLLAGIASRQCFHSGTGRNYLTIELTERHGSKSQYHIYFSLKREERNLVIFVESAYLNNDRPRKPRKKIKGLVLLAKSFRREGISTPR